MPGFAISFQGEPLQSRAIWQVFNQLTKIELSAFVPGVADDRMAYGIGNCDMRASSAEELEEGRCEVHLGKQIQSTCQQPCVTHKTALFEGCS